MRYIVSSWWRHHMETFSALLALCVGNSPVAGEFPAQRPMAQSFVFFMRASINGWVNNREPGDPRRHRAHCDVIVMWDGIVIWKPFPLYWLFMRALVTGGFPSQRASNTVIAYPVKIFTARSRNPRSTEYCHVLEGILIMITNVFEEIKWFRWVVVSISKLGILWIRPEAVIYAGFITVMDQLLPIFMETADLCRGCSTKYLTVHQQHPQHLM